MVKLAWAIAVPLLAFAGSAYSIPAQRSETTASLTDMSAQQRQRPRIVVRPSRPASYPGPNAVRQCTAWLQPENRPSGVVITPQMHCRWVRG